MDSLSKSRIVLEAARHLGWSDPAQVAEYARRLELGLPAEDELCVLFNWLGRCSLVHKLDQFPYPPGATSRYRVPDLFALFDVEGKPVPVLIEVKTSTDNVLSWKPDYLEALQRYANLLGLPLLVAWKHMTFWTLFEPRHLRQATKNLNISFSNAMRESLMGALAGDFSFSFQGGAGFHLRMRKLGGRNEDNTFEARIEEAYFTKADGTKQAASPGLLQLFMCVDQDANTTETETHLVQSYTTNDQSFQFAHRALVAMLGGFDEKGKGEWRQVLLRDQLPLLEIGPRKAASLAMEAGFLGLLLDIHPYSWPAFLPLGNEQSS